MNTPLFCPTEAQVVALLSATHWPSLYELSRWNCCSPFENVLHAVQGNRFTWRELFDAPESVLAMAFDDWRLERDT